jgi:secondary thiamine-phosphate synthase enzyme
MASLRVHSEPLTVRTTSKGTYEITEEIRGVVTRSGIAAGTATVFVQHTSCSLILMESADPTARADLEKYFDRLVPENEPYFEHNDEGPDDMPSHIRMSLSDYHVGVRRPEIQVDDFALEIRELHWFALRKISTMGASRSREITGAEVSSSCGLLLIENGLMRLSSETIAHHFAEVPPAPPKLFDLDDWLQGRRVRDACVFGS